MPSAGLGALLALIVEGSELTIIAVIGIVLLIGIVKKNGILIVDFALDAQREQGLSPREAIFRASLLRFRPILMTTAAALFGALPLMLGSGTGSELRHPLGVTIVGGLIVSQILTLFTTPVIYLAFDRLGRAAPASLRAPAQPGRSRPVTSTGGFSAIFIRRPVGTTLLTLGLALAGLAAFLQLPVAPLPQVDYPTIVVSAQMAGREPGDDGDERRDPARALSRGHRRCHRDDLVEHGRLDPHHAAIRAQPRHRGSRARRAGRDQRRARRPAGEPAEATRPIARSIRPTRRS